MNKIKLPLILISILIIAVIGLSGCEKDDICVDGTTPLLIVSFYDVDNRTELKKVPKFRVVGIGQKTTVIGVADRTDLDSIAIPLKVDKDITGFYFISNSVDIDAEDANGQAIKVEGGDLDSLYFKYNRDNKFISRACGFITNFDNLEGDLKLEGENWIKDMEVIIPLVDNSTETHVKIYH